MRAQTTTATAAQVRDNFLITGDKLEARRSIFDAVEQTMDIERSADMAIAIMKGLEETVKAGAATLPTGRLPTAWHGP